ncbi:MAG TPA: hypothetical protein VGG06_12355 [Thermoanaerobaculia bacterium]
MAIRMKQRLGQAMLAALVAAAGLAAAGAEERSLEEGFLRRGLAAQQGKGFNVAGDFAIGGFLGVGTDNPVRSVHLQDRNAVFRMDRDVNSAAFLLVRTAPNNFNSILKTYAIGADASGVNAGRFIINDLGTALVGGGVRRLTIDNEGNFGLNTTDPVASLQVHSTGSPFLFGLVDDADVRLTVDAGGALTINDRLVLARQSTTPNGHALGQESTLLADRGAVLESFEDEAWLALNGDNALLVSPGDGPLGLLSIFDEDDLQLNPAASPRYTFSGNVLELLGASSKALAAPGVDNAGSLSLQTAGGEVRMLVDDDGDRPQAGGFVYRFFQSDTMNANTLVGWDQDGDLGITGTLFENNAFDLAEGFWKGDAPIEPGDVVRVAPQAANSVVLAERAADPAVLGVVSTDPGIVMGGGAFAVEHLAASWGEEIAEIFERERADFELKALDRRPDLQELAAALASFEGFVARLRPEAGLAKAFSKPADEEALHAAYRDELRRLGQDLESAALKVFFDERFVRLALAGRVPVKADASYGAIRPGDLLVASPTPGHAMRAADPAPGTVIGKALEALEGDTGRVMMLVMMR